MTILLPIRIVLSSLPESSITLERILARLLPCSTSVWMRIRLTVVIAVSADEKKAESKTRISRTISCIGTLESNEVHSFFNHIVVRYNTIYMISEKKASFKKFRIGGVENEKTVL